MYIRFLTLCFIFIITASSAIAGLGLSNSSVGSLGITSRLGGTVFEFPLLSDVAGLNVQCDYDATNELSYDGTGTAWTDLEGNCADLTLNGAISFVGTAGDRSAYLEVDSGGDLYFGATESDGSSNPSSINTLMNPSGGGSAWIIMSMNSGDDPKAGGGGVFGTFGTGSFYLRRTNAGDLKLDFATTAEEQLSSEFVELPRRDIVYIYNFDHDRGKLRVFNNLDEYFEFDYTNTSGAITSPRSFHFFSDDVLGNTSNNKRIYSIATGTGLITRDQARGIFTTHNLRTNKTFASWADCGTGWVHDCIPETLFEIQASNSSFDNLTGNTNYNFTNSGLTLQTDGTRSWWLTDGNDSAAVPITTSTPELREFADWTNADGSHLFCAIAIRTADTVTFDQAFFGNTNCSDAEANGACAETGSSLRYGENAGVGKMVIEADYLGIREAHSELNTPLQPNTDYVLGYRYGAYIGNGPTLATSMGNYINTDVIAGTTNNLTNSGTPANFISTGQWVMGARYDNDTASPDFYLDSGTRIYGHVCSTALDTKASVNKVVRDFERINTIDFDKNGIIGIVGNVAQDGNAYASALQISSGSAVGTISAPSSGLASVEPSTLFELESTNTDSYSGSGTTWADVGGDTNYNFTNNGVTFTGTAGDAGAHWSFASGDFFLISGGNTTFLDTLHQDGQAFWIAFRFDKTDNSWQNESFFSTVTSTAASNDGFTFQQSSFGGFNVRQYGGTAATSFSSSNNETAGQHVFVMSYDGAGNWLTWMDGVETSGTITFDASAVVATEDARIGGTGNNTWPIQGETDLYTVAMGNAHLDTTKAAAIRTELNNRWP